MKKLLLIMILILSFVGCKDKEVLELAESNSPKKGAKFKVYSYEEKLDIARKVNSKKRVPDELFPQYIYPKVAKEYLDNLDIIDSERGNGNEKAIQERKEWRKAFSEVGYIPIVDSTQNNN